jgi:hypothetical protein
MAGCGRARWCAAAVALMCATGLGAGCAAGKPTSPAGHTGSRPAVAGAARHAPAARYLAIARAGNRRLDAEFGRLHGRDRRRLAGARADLRAVAATERLFDRRLLAIVFPPVTERFAHFLYWVNQARATLTIAAATSVSLSQLHAYEQRLAAANIPVEQAVKTIRQQLGLPPPSAS